MAGGLFIQSNGWEGEVGGLTVSFSLKAEYIGRPTGHRGKAHEHALGVTPSAGAKSEIQTKAHFSVKI